MNTYKLCKRLNQALILLLFCLFTGNSIIAQSFNPPIPVEAFFGHEALYSQLVVKRKFTGESKFAYFGLATYTASYDNDQDGNSLVIINQISYNFKKGFGVMAGADMNSAVGFSPVIGPQHNYASKKWLAVTVVSFFLNADKNLKLFGLYEFKPKINEKWTMYNRLQFIYKWNLNEGLHSRSYIYLRTGLKRNAFIFGLAANLDQFGPNKSFKDNYGIFVRYEFK